jgi:hypothetical protein
MPTPPLTRRLLGLLVVALLAWPAGPATAAPKPRSAPATFGIGPANAHKLDGRPYLTYLTAPGAALSDHVALVNLGTKRITVNVYTVDATVTSDGKFGYLPRRSARQDASSWFTLRIPGGGSTVTLAPRATTIVPITISVPRGAEPGDHAAGVITSLTSKVTDNQGKKIDFEQRVALRAFFRISGPLHPQLAIQNLHARYHGSLTSGDVTLTYTVRNLGNVRLGARQKVVVSGLFGARSPKRALPDVPLLLPGTAVSMKVTVHDVLPQVRLHARVRLYPLTVAGDVDPGLPTSFTKTVAVWAVPWGFLVLVAGLVTGALVLIGVRRAKTPA